MKRILEHSGTSKGQTAISKKTLCQKKMKMLVSRSMRIAKRTKKMVLGLRLLYDHFRKEGVPRKQTSMMTWL